MNKHGMRRREAERLSSWAFWVHILPMQKLRILNGGKSRCASFWLRGVWDLLEAILL